MGSDVLTGVGLAAPAGLNAYIPLLVVALADRFSNLIILPRPYSLISSNAGMAILIVLLTIEIVADKVPGVDHANDLVQTMIRPAAGAALMLASNADRGLVNPVLAFLLGATTAGLVHLGKAATRPAVTLSTGGLGSPLVSIVEDFFATVTSVTALVAPSLVLVFLVMIAVALYGGYRWFRRRPRAASLKSQR